MYFIYPRDIIAEITQSRVVNIAGSVGKGKTLLQVAIAIELWKMNYVDHIVTTFPMGGRTIDTTGIEKRFVVLADELGKIMDARHYSKNNPNVFINDIRKKDAFFISASRTPVDKRFRDIYIERTRPNFGNFAWRYAYEIEEANKIIPGAFWLINPSYLFGLYPTKHIVLDEDFEPIRELMSRGVEGRQMTYSEQDFQWFVRDGLQIIRRTEEYGTGFKDKRIYEKKGFFYFLKKFFSTKQTA